MVEINEKAVRDAAEVFSEWHSTFDEALKSGTNGFWPCGRCRANAEWDREGRYWKIFCPLCAWNACGAMSEADIPKNS